VLRIDDDDDDDDDDVEENHQSNQYIQTRRSLLTWLSSPSPPSLLWRGGSARRGDPGENGDRGRGRGSVGRAHLIRDR
jgi:hypothetical protein